MSQTIFEKIWQSHEIGGDLLYIDLHLVHEVTSPQAFDGLRLAGLPVRAAERTLATIDHNVPTDGPKALQDIRDSLSRKQIEALQKNCQEFGVPLLDLESRHRGIVHVVGPELGLTQPGMTIVCGDSHTSTHGAFGALAFGIGTSEVEHVLATQTLSWSPPQQMRITYSGEMGPEVSAKDLILATIARWGTDGMQGYVVEYAGPGIEDLSMEERMTICNMTIEGGGRAGLIAPDQKTVDWISGRPGAPENMDQAVSDWIKLSSDQDSRWDRQEEFDLRTLAPTVTWGTTPAQAVEITGSVPEPTSESEERALEYMDLQPGTAMQEIKIDRVFLGSCTNARLGDLRAAAEVASQYPVHPHVRAMVVPGSEAVRVAAEKEGLDAVFRQAGWEWRSAGCSMCLGMNPDMLGPGERCASTSNRNFEGRQGAGGRTHLLSPRMAVAAAARGHLADVRELIS